MKKVLPLIAFLLIATFATQCLAFAEDAMLLSSIMFRSVSVQGSSTGTVTFSAMLNQQCSEVKISSCILQYYNNSEWSYASTLNVPASKTNTFRYGASMDYSSFLSHGTTYRVVVVFNADGESVTTTSNSFSY